MSTGHNRSHCNSREVYTEVLLRSTAVLRSNFY